MKMKKIKGIISILMVTALLAGCGTTAANTTTTTTPTSGAASSDATVTAEPTKEPTEDVQDPETSDATENTGDFTITVDEEKGGTFTQSGSVYTITSAGTYVLTGTLTEGSIVVAAGEDDEVNIELSGCSITCSTAAPISVETAGEVKIKSVEDTVNRITDSRETATSDSTSDEDTAGAAIYATCDLSLTGKGTLIVKANCNNGIQSKDSLSIKNVTLKVQAVNNALKGNEEVNIESGELLLISTAGNGIKTSDTSLSSKGNQRGNINITGGSITIYAEYDGIDAAFDLTIETDGKISVYTGKYGTYSSDSADAASGTVESTVSDSTDTEGSVITTGWWGGGWGGNNWGGSSSSSSDPSEKALKAGNSITVNAGEIVIKAEDDAIHAGTDDSFESGVSSTGTVTINGGTFTITSGDDGIHGDGYVTINNGNVTITTAYEGIEANVITFNGGNVYVYATDDGLNASSGTAGVTPIINVTGGYLEVTTPSGDTDAVDSNGSFKMTGGIAFIKGGASTGSMAGSVDVDGTITVTGGTIVALGGICETPTNSQNAYSKSGQSFSSGTYSFQDADGNTIFSFTLTASYSSFWICSDALTTGSTFTLYKGTTSVVSWTQTAGTMGSSSGWGGMGGGGKGGRW